MAATSTPREVARRERSGTGSAARQRQRLEADAPAGSLGARHRRFAAGGIAETVRRHTGRCHQGSESQSGCAHWRAKATTANWRNVYEGGAAHRAGLSGGDLLVALDGLRVSATNLDSLLARYRVGDAVTVHAFRRDELLSFEVGLIADEAPQMELVTEGKPAVAVRARDAWLGG